MRLLKRHRLLLKAIVVLGSLLMLYIINNSTTGWNPTYAFGYSWLEYTDADGGPERVCNCPAILQGKREALEEAKLLTITKAFQDRIHTPDESYIRATQNCMNFKIRRKYLTFPLSKEEEDFPLAYSIVVHHKVENFERLLRAIYSPQNIYCVHVDLKADPSVLSAIRAITSCFTNVFMVSKAVSVVYGGWSRVQADLNCMADLYRGSTKWKYFINLCGQDFPLKTNLEIVRMLRALSGGNSLESEKLPQDKMIRVTHVHKIVNGQMQVRIFKSVQRKVQNIPDDSNIEAMFPMSQRTGKRKQPPPFNLPLMSGNAYIVVNRGYVQSVLEDYRILALIMWAKDTYSPDEFLWATIQRIPGVPGSTWPNRKYDMTDLNAIVRLVKWQWHEGSEDSLQAVYPECQGSHVREICVYGAGDLQWMLKHHHLFANKFDTERDPIAVYCLEKHLRQKALSELY